MFMHQLQSVTGQRLFLQGGIYVLAFLASCLYGRVEALRSCPEKAQGQRQADASSWQGTEM